MPDLSLILERYGKIGTIDSILPELAVPRDEFGSRASIWPSAIGMIRIDEITVATENVDLAPNLTASIMISRSDRGYPIDVTEFHGVMFFRPLDGMRWNEQIAAIKGRPSLFEVVPVTRLESGKEYAFFARRAAKVNRAARSKLT